MEKAVCVDWLSFTAPKNEGASSYIIPPWVTPGEFVIDTPRFGYRQSHKYECGLIVMWGGASDTMGAHYIYSGQALASLAEGVPDGGRRVIAWHEAQSHKCTRIDLAVDVFEGLRVLADVARMSENREFAGTAHSATTIRSSDGRGLTVYVGSRTSERFVRIYNKSAQLHEEGNWTRIECEVKSDSARAVARAILGAGTSGIDLVARSVINRVCEFPVASWYEIFSGDEIPIGTPKIEERATEKWILEIVAKAVAKFERQYPRKKILERLWNAIEDSLGE